MTKQIKVSEETYNEIKKLAEKMNMSMSQFVEHLLELYKTGGSEEKAIKKIVEKEDFPLLYPSRCRECGKELKAGDRVYYVKYVYEDGTSKTYITCTDCYINGRARSLALVYRKKRELEAVIKELKKEADVLAEKVNNLERINSIISECERLYQEVQNTYRNFVNTLMDVYSSDTGEKIMKIFEEVMGISQRLASLEKEVARVVQFQASYGDERRKKVRVHGVLRENI
jgi:Ribbon-helix-helix protein, copG family.